MRAIIYLLGILGIVGASCARRGSINGGPRDTLAPRVTRLFPAHLSKHFQSKKIEFEFDEYVMLKDFDKQLVTSPPLQNRPEVVPAPGTATRSFTLTLKDTLAENTTYTFHFGNSIQDNNEGNPIKNFQYVFSTGASLDSLTLQLQLRDAFRPSLGGNAAALLYPDNGDWSDSLVCHKKPLYIAIADSLGKAELRNVKAGRYRLLALKEKNVNLTYQAKDDMIGFETQPITLPTTSVPLLKLFSAKQAFKPLTPYPDAQQRYVLPYEGQLDPSLRLTQLDKDNELTLPFVRLPEKDSIWVWVPRTKNDSTQIRLSWGKCSKDLRLAVKKMQRDSLLIKPVGPSTIPLQGRVTLGSNAPIIKVNEALMQWTVGAPPKPLPHQLRFEALGTQLAFQLPVESSQKYQLRLLPGALTDWYGRTNDTLRMSFDTRSETDYGILRLHLKGALQYPLKVDLTDAKGKEIYSQMTQNGELEFYAIEPAKYTVRVIEDRNQNGRWDSGDWFEKIQPERVYYHKTTLDVRANWDVDQTITIESFD